MNTCYLTLFDCIFYVNFYCFSVRALIIIQVWLPTVRKKSLVNCDLVRVT